MIICKYCKECKEAITNKYYKCLWISDNKTKLVICQSCYMNYYILKPYLFKLRHPEEYNEEYKSIYNNKCQK